MRPRRFLGSPLSGLGLILAALLAWLAPVPAHAQGTLFGRVNLYLTATPNRVPADGKTRARLRVDLRDDQGRPYADRTPVVLHTDFGELTTTGADRQATVNLESRGGVVSAYLLSSAPGLAMVTVTCLNSRIQGMVEFVTPGETGLVETRVVHVGGGWTGYALEQNLIEARDQAWVRFGRVRLEGADLLQLSVEQMLLRGGPGVLSLGERRLEGSDFYLDLPHKRGVLRRLSESGVERLTFDLTTLEPRAMDWEIPDDAFQRERNSSSNWILAREITVFSGEKLVFRRGGLYSEEKKVMSLPRIWIMALPGYTGAANNQVFGLSSSGDLAVRFPYFVHAGENTTNAIELQKGAPATSIAGQNAWGLGLTHEYRFGQTSGVVSINGLPRSEWGLGWRDSRTLWGGASAVFNLASPDHRSLYFDGSVYDYRPGYSLNLRAFYQRPTGFTDAYGLVSEWLTDPRSWGKGPHAPSYRLGTSVGAQKGGFLTGRGVQLVQELYASLDWRPLRLGSRTSLTPSLSNVFTWDTSPFHANNVRTELRLDHSFGEPADLSLTYSANHYSGEAPQRGWLQYLLSELRIYHGTKWMAAFSGELQLDSGDWYGLATWDYYLNQDWRVQLLGNWYRLGDTRYSDQYVFLGRRVFQNREIGVSWSRQTHEFSLELTGLATTF